MVRRTARRGANEGSEFWGCPDFPKCRGMRPDEPVADSDAPRNETVPAARAQDADAGAGRRKWLDRAAGAVDSFKRWNLESDEPDATGRWDSDHRQQMLKYVYKRDQGRCGLCAGEMKLKGAQIEHVVPKIFAMFDVSKGGTAEKGTRYRSRLHKIDNLQAAHSYCNKSKGNKPEVSEWRHPAMPPLTVADGTDGQTFVLPWSPPKRSKR